MTTIDTLLSQGWREYPDASKPHQRHFYKRFKTPTRCHCNNEKTGMWVRVGVSRATDTYEIDLCGELPDGTWIELHNHAMPNDINEGLAMVPRLLGLWEAAAGVETVSSV